MLFIRASWFMYTCYTCLIYPFPRRASRNMSLQLGSFEAFVPSRDGCKCGAVYASGASRFLWIFMPLAHKIRRVCAKCWFTGKSDRGRRVESSRAAGTWTGLKSGDKEVVAYVKCFWRDLVLYAIDQNQTKREKFSK